MGLNFIKEREALQLAKFFVGVMFRSAYALPIGLFFRESACCTYAAALRQSELPVLLGLS